MKQEAKKSKKWLLPVLIVAAILVAVGVVLAFTLGGGQQTAVEEEQQAQKVITSKLYWNIDRLSFLDEESMFSNREPAEDGLYHIRFAVGGKQEEYLVADKKLVNYIDSMDVMGLEFDSDGNIIDALDPELFATEIALGFFVQYQENGKLFINSSLALNGMKNQIDLDGSVGIYDVRPDAPTAGAIIECETLDKVMVYGDLDGNPTDVFVIERQPTADVYWRVTRMYNTTTKSTTRVPDENGVYTILSAFNGEQVEIKTKDKSIVDLIDQGGRYDGAYAPIFDEDGYIVSLLGITKALRGAFPANSYDVTALDGNSISAEYKMTGNNQGKTWNGTMHPDCKIYNVSDGGTALVIGEATTLQVDDRVLIYTNGKGEAILIYVVNRVVDLPMYYNPTRMYSGGVTTRVPDANGYYVFTLAVDGVLREFKTKDKDIASKVDSYSYGIFTIETEGNIIKRVYNPECVTGYYSVGNNCTVTDKIGVIITLTNLASNTATNPLMAGDCKVYNVSGVGGAIGAPGEIQVGDQIIAYTGPGGDLRYVYIVSRYTGTPVFWNHTRKYNAKTAETTRVPDADGYYVFRVASDGKDMTVRTKSKELASKMDSYNPQWFSLKLRGDIVEDVYPVTAATGGIVRSSYFAVKNISATQLETYSLAGSGTTMLTPGEKMKVYNISGAYDKTWGEETKLQVGDQIHALTDQSGKAVIIYIRSRKVDSQMYWNKTRMYNTTKAETTRKPDADGYYVFDLAVNGEVKKFKTKDKDIASKVDSYRVAFGLKVKGDIIEAVYSVTSINGVKAEAVSWWDVYEMGNGKITFRSNIGTDKTFGQTKEFKLAKNCKVYDACGYVNPFGSQVELEIGDRVQAYTNDDNEVAYVYIPRDNTRKEGGVGYCSHCDQIVTWCPWSGEELYKSDGHYHLTHDLTITTQRTAGDTTGDTDAAAAKAYDIVIDLNGNTLTSNARTFRVCYGTELTIMDSVGGGTMQAKGLAGIGGNMLIQRGGKVNLMGGTLKLTDNAKTPSSGGVIHLSGAESAFTMTGGKIIGGTVSANGGAIYYDSGKLDIRGGTITGGTAVAGGNIYVNQAKGGTITGATISNGTTTTSVGGNIFIGGKGDLTLKDCTVSGGTANRGGGNIYSSGGLYIDGGKFLAAQTTGSGPNVCVETGKFHISGDAYFDGGVRVLGASEFKLSGKPVIENKSVYFGVWQNEGVKMTVDGLVKGADVGIYSSTAFATGTDTAALQKLVDDACFHSEDPKKVIAVLGNDLVPAYHRCALGHTEHTGANASCAASLTYWYPWSNANALPTEAGSYYLTKALTLGNNITISKDINLDLNGFNVTGTIPAATSDWAARHLFNVPAGVSVGITDLSATPGTITIKTNNQTVCTGALFNVKGDLTVWGGKMDASAAASNYEDAVAINVASGATFTMYDGSVKGVAGAVSSAAKTNGSTLYVAAGATANIHGGELIGVSGKLGANVHVKGKLNVTGGTLVGGDVGVIGVAENVYVDGANAEVTISGGTFNGAVQAQNFASFTVSGNPVITSTKTYGLIVPAGKMITVDGLTADASIRVFASGAFATAADANELAAVVANKNFVPDSVVQEVVINGQNLEIKIADTITRCAAGHYSHDGVECDAAIVEWKPWNDATTFPTEGNYFLTTNLEIGTANVINRNVAIDLNGYNINGTAPSGAAWVQKRLFQLAAGSTLTITDLSGKTVGTVKMTTGTDVTAASGALAYVGGTLNLYNGVLDASKLLSNYDDAAAITVVSTGNFNMYGGTVKGLSGKSTKGSALYVYGQATANIYGGVMVGLRASNGGNIYNIGKLNIYGGIFNAGALTNPATGYGANIYVNSENAEVKILGGVFDGDVWADNFKTFTLGGNPVITAGTYCGLYVKDGKELTLTAMEDGADVAMSVYGTFASSSDAAVLNSWKNSGFTTTNGTAIKISGDKLTADVPMRCALGHESHTGEYADCQESIVEWTPWTSKNSLPTADGNYILTAPVAIANNQTITNNYNLDLNGYTITCTVPAGSDWAVRRFATVAAGATVGITDLSAKQTGKIAMVMNGQTSCDGAIFMVNGNLNLYGGLLDGSNVSSNCAGGTAICVRGGNFTMYGGIIKGVAGANNTTASKNNTSGSTISSFAGSKVNIHGGELIGTVGKYGANIYSAADLTITGGKLTGGTLATGGVANNIFAVKSGTNSAKVVITGNAKIDGGIYAEGIDSLHIGGKAVLTPGTTSKAQYELNLHNGVPVVDESGNALFTVNGGSQTDTKYYVRYNSNGEVMGICPVTDTAAETTLQVGYARKDITPTASLPLGGYGNTEDRMSSNVLDNLYVTCIAVTDAEGNTVLLYTQDVINSAVYNINTLRNDISGETGVAADNIIVAATHTHSAPDTSATTDATIAWKTQYKQAMIAAAQEALADRKAAQMFSGAVATDGMNFTRHYVMEDGTVSGSNFGNFNLTPVSHQHENDPVMQVIKFDRAGDDDVYMMNFQAHPTMSGGQTTPDISADFIGATRTYVEANVTGAKFAYFTGATGNEVVDSRLEEEKHDMEMVAYGEALGKYLVDMLPELAQVKTTAIKTVTTTFEYEINHEWDDKVEQAREVVDVWKNGAGKWAARELAHSYGFSSEYHASAIISRVNMGATGKFKITAVSIGDFAMVVAPYEMFSVQGMEIKGQSPFDMTFVITCANGSNGYMAPADAYDYNSYESTTCAYAKGVAEALADTYLKMLVSLKNQ